MKIYKVGGAVRDKLLGLPVTDCDWVVVGATVEDMLARKFLQVGRDFPVFLHPETKEEYALARTERKSGVGYTGFVVHTSPDVTLEQDLQRRDLTINAIAEATDGALIDPYGGRADLAARVLRHVAPAFSEDPLRVLRVARFAARFAALGFKVAPETRELMRAMTAAGELQHLVPERVWQELHAALLTDAPQVFFSTLRDCGALAVIVPEFGTDTQRFDVLEQAALLTTNALVRFAALVLDLDAAAIDVMTARLRVPNDFSELGRLAALHHARCHDADHHGAEDWFVTLERTDALRRSERFELFLRACEADARGRIGLEHRPYLQAGMLRAALNAARAVNVQALVQRHPEPQELGPAIRAARVAAIAALQPEARS
jgi:tRNA nucleotidyltransferase (CCA-adding enzyme)